MSIGDPSHHIHTARDTFTAALPAVTPLAAFEIVIVPGLYGSGPEHWQSRWQRLLRRQGITVRRVEQDDWANPTYEAWSRSLHHTLRTCHRPVILVAHSLGAVLVARQAAAHHLPMAAGALLVAPADVEQHTGPDAARVAGFAPLPIAPLPLPSVLVASRNDEWLAPPRAEALATRWGSTLIDAGRIGHIGSTSGVGLWPTGLSTLVQMARTLATPHDTRPALEKTAPQNSRITPAPSPAGRNDPSAYARSGQLRTGSFG